MFTKDDKIGSHLIKHARPEETLLELDKLFKKTKTIPCIYYLPMNEEMAKERKKKIAELKK